MSWNVASNGALRRASTSMACVGLLLAGCATAPPPEDKQLPPFKEANDPYEPFNRAMSIQSSSTGDPMAGDISLFGNRSRSAADKCLQFLQNLRGPVIFANDLFQGELDRASTVLSGFAMNSTFGVFLGSMISRPRSVSRSTMKISVKLSPPGNRIRPYLVLPIFGPSARETVSACWRIR